NYYYSNTPTGTISTTPTTTITILMYFCCCVLGSAAVAFMSYSNMNNMLKPNFFNTTDNDTVKTMMSTVVSHIEETDPNGTLSCVYWKNTEWVVDGCYLVQTNSTHTVCSCVHLSTFALIMQTKPSSDPLLDRINTVLVSVGLVFLILTLLTFTVCQYPTALFLCFYLSFQMLCAVLAGVLHFFFLSAFVWMLIEAVLLFISVKNLTKIRSKQKEVLGWKCLIIIGYIIPLVVVGVSVGSLYPLFVGPVCVILASAILGCPWILGFFTDRSQVLEMVFLFLNSQQGTFIFLVYCILNQEVSHTTVLVKHEIVKKKKSWKTFHFC
uniref:GAIN-B domain-containing protein n=1 Tax=Astyanax mexicanus TaxID=7994 RepID=A0A3B1K2U2_ASTMX